MAGCVGFVCVCVFVCLWWDTGYVFPYLSVWLWVATHVWLHIGTCGLPLSSLRECASTVSHRSKQGWIDNRVRRATAQGTQTSRGPKSMKVWICTTKAQYQLRWVLHFYLISWSCRVKGPLSQSSFREEPILHEAQCTHHTCREYRVENRCLLWLWRELSKFWEHLESCFWPLDECKSNIHSSFSSVFALYQLLREIFGSFAPKCSKCSPASPQLCLCTIVYCGFLRAFSLKTAACTMRAVRENQNSKVVVGQTMNWKSL